MNKSNIFYPNVPNPDNQDPIERLKEIESMVSKKQFALIQFIKIFIVFDQESKEGKVNPEHVLMAMELALIGKEVPINPEIIRNSKVVEKIEWYFRKYGEIYK